ncbi:phosphatidylglycerophosphatase A [Massilia sp. W12]|uniref:phosphatidylglycerophosphatase A family protein n=1 Tax=Massilia sp. W12 TaxID=3126507 RepID=UPI0030CC7EA0
MKTHLHQVEAGRVQPGALFMYSRLSHLLALGFGSGLSPIMPGTVGTLFGWLTFAMFTQRWPAFFTPLNWLIVCLAAFLIGIWACERTGRDLGVADHGAMVWDEIVAIWLVLAMLHPAPWQLQFWAVFWFRVFDMSKPPPIRQFEQRFKGGFGVMFDDILAAFFTLLLFSIWRQW